jgi:8-oxo-dGTP diphosphatase
MSDTYQPPILTVDCVIFALQDNNLSVLLIKRMNEPFKASWALPGGYNPRGETTHEALARIVKDKAGTSPESLAYVEQLYTFDTVARDPRGHAVSVTYMGLGMDINIRTSGRVQQPTFFPLDHLPDMAFDHQDIIDYALARLRSKVMYTNVISSLLPHTFTLSQLQSAYEAVLGMELDKRNFRKKIYAQSLVVPTGEYLKEGAHRPAQLYQFKHSEFIYLSADF